MLLPKANYIYSLGITPSTGLPLLFSAKQPLLPTHYHAMFICIFVYTLHGARLISCRFFFSSFSYKVCHLCTLSAPLLVSRTYHIFKHSLLYHTERSFHYVRAATCSFPSRSVKLISLDLSLIKRSVLHRRPHGSYRRIRRSGGKYFDAS